jgi:DNA-binding NarL/FixJ family response regulator
MTPIRVLICDDQAVVCEGLRAILSTDPRYPVVAWLTTARSPRPDPTLRPD